MLDIWDHISVFVGVFWEDTIVFVAGRHEVVVIDH